ncbi:MAG TPA: lytic transglycosylase domain-containing protein [Acetobacteraceae bacterium]|nr:lytic transglycosylase domain-containing protein [Acetobacteraceae bacterium]
MTRPSPIRTVVRLAASALLLGLLAACAGQQAADDGSNAPQQAAAYAAHARGNYVPPGPPEDPWGPYIREAAQRFDIPEEWVRAVMRVESGGQEYRDGQLVTSHAGAMGLMQVMPQTYAELQERYGLGGDPFEPHDNIIAGVAYMRELYDIYGSPGFLAAYNGGPNRLDDYLSNLRPLPDETRHYVAMIAPAIEGIYPQRRSPAEAYAMNELPEDIPPGLRYGGHVLLASAHGKAPSRHTPGRHETMVARAALKSHPDREGRPVEVAMVLPPEPPSRPSTVAEHGRARGRGLHLIATAQAAEAGVPHASGNGWAVQVGAFSSASLAQHAAGQARADARGGTASVSRANPKLWRARVTGLSRDAAVEACHKLSHAHGACIVVSPASQS